MTNSRVVGYYVHHHGEGHTTRFRAIAAASQRCIVPLSTRDDLGPGLVLPTDVPSVESNDPTAGGSLHWAPLNPETATRRLRALVDWLDVVRPAGVVVDVSAEVALTCRLAGVATMVVRQHGNRDDRGHRAAYSAATRLIAPFPRALDRASSFDVLAKTDHVGFIRPRRPRTTVATSNPQPRHNDAVVLWGRGGGRLSGAFVDAIAEHIDGVVYCAGEDIWPDGDGPTSDNLVMLGWVPDVGALLVNAPLVLASAGNNCVADAATARCPLIVVPLPRPFDEQLHHAAALEAAGVAIVAADPIDRSFWTRAIAGARDGARRWGELEPDRDGAEAAAAMIDRWFV